MTSNRVLNLRELDRPFFRETVALLLTTDFYEDHRASLTYCGPGDHFAVNWNIFDRDLLEQIVLKHPSFTVTDPPDLNVNWPVMKEQMLRFHGYPYTSVGVALIKR
jgi:hypothetical protein